MIVLASPGGSPGVTTAALALAMTWPKPVIMTEGDPAGGTVLPGLWRERAGSDSAGLLRFAGAVQRGQAPRAGPYLLPLEDPPGTRSVLAAPPDPATARQIAATWPRLAPSLAAAGADIIVDVGRLDAPQQLGALLTAADLVLMTCRPTIRQAAAARPRLDALSKTRPADAILLIGNGDYGPDASRAMRRALSVDVAGHLPFDGPAAAVLSDGAPAPRRFGHSALMRAARDLAGQLDERPAAHLAVAAPAGARP